MPDAVTYAQRSPQRACGMIPISTPACRGTGELHGVVHQTGRTSAGAVEAWTMPAAAEPKATCSIPVRRWLATAIKPVGCADVLLHADLAISSSFTTCGTVPVEGGDELVIA